MCLWLFSFLENLDNSFWLIILIFQKCFLGSFLYGIGVDKRVWRWENEEILEYLRLKIIPYNNYLVYLHPKNRKDMAKVIHVHLVGRGRYERKDYYFSSITAVYSVLTADEVGATKSYLLHAGLSGNGTVATKKAIIKQSTLITGKGIEEEE